MGLIRRYTTANPHLKIALVVAPLLAVGGYIAADLYSSQREEAPAPKDQPLRIEGTCRLVGGVCKLLHREIAVNLGAESDPAGGVWIYLRASIPIEGALLALDDAPPRPMTRRGDATRWKLHLNALPRTDGRLRLVVAREGHRYYAEVPLSP